MARIYVTLTFLNSVPLPISRVKPFAEISCMYIYFGSFEMFHGQKSQEWRQTCQSVLGESVSHAHWPSPFPRFNETESKLAYKTAVSLRLSPWNAPSFETSQAASSREKRLLKSTWNVKQNKKNEASIPSSHFIDQPGQQNIYSFSFLRKT